MTLEAFGDEAARSAGRIPGPATILACEPATAPQALRRALELRRAGIRFALSVHVEDVRSTVARERAAGFSAAYASWDEVRLLLDDAAPEIAAARAVLPEEQAAALIEAIRLSDGVIVGSWREHGRLLDTLGIVPRAASIVVNADPDVPAEVGAERSAVVVYAPRQRAGELAAFVVTLADLALPVTVIAHDAPAIPGRVAFVAPAHAAAALGTARIIVDATGNDPGTALALAGLGRPLVVDAAGGAAEILRDAGTYERWNRRSILAAVTNALAGSPPGVRRGAFDDRPPVRPPLACGADAPLVSVIVTTYNRPLLLAAALATIQAQTYPNLEIVVVNDGGTDVRDVVARCSRARLIERANGGPGAARNSGLAAARGTFVMFFDDDDEMFPDHVAALALAALNSGLDVAYGQMINAIADVGPDGRHAIRSLAGHVALLDHADIQWAGSLAPPALLFRRSLIELVGGVDETLPIAEDYDLWLRLAAGREFARVADITSLYFIRPDGSSRTHGNAARYHAAHRTIYAKHPSDRPLVLAGRASMLEFFQQHSAPA